MTGESSLFLSIVFCGKNDDPRSSDFSQRADRAMRHNAALLARKAVSSEVVFVEWNSDPVRPAFYPKVRKNFPKARIIVVPMELHRRLCRNPQLGLLQFFAKNAGIRQAGGKFILCTNADTYLRSELLTTLVEREDELDEAKLYLAVRNDYGKDFIPLPNDESIVDFSSAKPVMVNRIIPPWKYEACGDFTLASKRLWEELGGYFEGIDFVNLHLDTLLIKQAEKLSIPVEIIGMVDHLAHDDYNNIAENEIGSRHGIDYAWHLIDLPYRNSADWGNYDFCRSGKNQVLEAVVAKSARDPFDQMGGRAIVPRKFIESVVFPEVFELCLTLVLRFGLRFAIFGYGNEAKRFCTVRRDEVAGLLVAIADENPDMIVSPFPEVPVLQPRQLNKDTFDCLLLGSRLWYDRLSLKARQIFGPDQVFPDLSFCSHYPDRSWRNIFEESMIRLLGSSGRPVVGGAATAASRAPLLRNSKPAKHSIPIVIRHGKSTTTAVDDIVDLDALQVKTIERIIWSDR